MYFINGEFKPYGAIIALYEWMKSGKVFLPPSYSGWKDTGTMWYLWDFFELEGQLEEGDFDPQIPEFEGKLDDLVKVIVQIPGVCQGEDGSLYWDTNDL